MYNNGSNTITAEAASGSNIGNSERKFVYSSQVDQPAIFSSKDFTCCTQLGKTPRNNDPSNCCSNYLAAPDKNGKRICKLPIETDLNVYFNRFVSNEGEYLPDDEKDAPTGLSDSDFNPWTGEPKSSEDVDKKIITLGEAYCDKGKVTEGAAFGQFLPQPNSGLVPSGFTPDKYPWSIIDSVFDSMGLSEDTKYKSKQGFDRGVRWSHHYYCHD
jgi:hypothetical protein